MFIKMHYCMFMSTYSRRSNSLSLCSSLFSIDIRVSFDNIISIFLSLQLFSKVFKHIFGEYGIKLVLNSSCVDFS